MTKKLLAFKGYYLTIIAVWISLALIFPYLDYHFGWFMYLLPLFSGVLIVLKDKDKFNLSYPLSFLAFLTPITELVWARIYGIDELFNPDKVNMCFNIFGANSYILFALVIPIYVQGMNILIYKNPKHA